MVNLMDSRRLKKVLMVSLYGYVFPYLEIANKTIRRCFRSGSGICCIELKLEKELEVRELFGDCDENPLYFFIDPKSNEVLLKAKDEYGLKNYEDIEYYSLVWSPDWYEILISAIISQNVSFSKFRKLLKVFVQAVGEKVVDDIKVFPEPRKVLKSKHKLNRLGLGYRTKWILEVTKHFLDSEPPTEGETMDIINDLKKIRGVGIYTATSYTLFHLRRLDTPLWDRFIAKNIMHDMLGLNVSSFREFDTVTKNLWGEHRGIVLASLVSSYYRKKAIKDLFKEL